MLALAWHGPMTNDGHDAIAFEATAPPAMTPDLAAALALLIRSALARRAERSERAA
jgi:hypothetical protein